MRHFAIALASAALALAGGCKANGENVQRQATVTILSNGQQHKFNAEVAITDAEQKQGLMNRASLAPDAAMLFPFPKPKIASFWMHNTQIPLDIFFIRSDGSIDRIAENTVPMSDVPIVSGGEVAAVLEVNGGTAARLKINETATIRWTFDK